MTRSKVTIGSGGHKYLTGGALSVKLPVKLAKPVSQRHDEPLPGAAPADYTVGGSGPQSGGNNSGYASGRK